MFRIQYVLKPTEFAAVTGLLYDSHRRPMTFASRDEAQAVADRFTRKMTVAGAPLIEYTVVPTNPTGVNR